MLLPKRVKYRRVHRGRLTGKAYARQQGDLRRVWPAGPGARVDHLQPDRGRPCCHDPLHASVSVQVWIKIFPDKPITEKPAETRMGSGKGSPEYWVAVVKPGRVMFEIGGVAGGDRPRGYCVWHANKLPIKCKFVKKEETEV